MSLKRIEIAGFKSLRELKLDLRPLNVLIGANGAGKSNFVSLFAMLQQMVLRNFQLYVATKGGANALLHFGHKQTDRIALKLSFEHNDYSCVWAPTVDERLVFAEETCGGYDDHAQCHNESLGIGHQESKLSEARQPEKRLAVATAVLENLQSRRVYHFHDTSETAQVKKIGDLNGNLYLRPDAGNLAALLFRLQHSRPKRLTRAKPPRLRSA